MRRMGHASITVIDDTYGHLFPERDVEITDALDGLFECRCGLLVDSPGIADGLGGLRIASDLHSCLRAGRDSNPQPSDP